MVAQNTNFDITLPVVISVISLVVAGAAFWVSRRNLGVNHANTELHILDAISMAKFRQMQFEQAMLTANVPAKKEKADMEEAIRASYLEGLMNAYEVACMTYLDKKVDTTRFKKTYIEEIDNLFESEITREIIEKKKYWAIQMVREKWINLEKKR